MNDPAQNIVGKRFVGTFQGVGWITYGLDKPPGFTTDFEQARIGDMAVYINASVRESETIDRVRTLMGMLNGTDPAIYELEDVTEFMDTVAACKLQLVSLRDD